MKSKEKEIQRTKPDQPSNNGSDDDETAGRECDGHRHRRRRRFLSVPKRNPMPAENIKKGEAQDPIQVENTQETKEKRTPPIILKTTKDFRRMREAQEREINMTTAYNERLEIKITLEESDDYMETSKSSWWTSIKRTQKI